MDEPPTSQAHSIIRGGVVSTIRERPTPELIALYAEAEANGFWLREWRIGDSYLAAAGLASELPALEARARRSGMLARTESLDPNCHLDLDDVVLGLTSFPGSGATRAAACSAATEGLRRFLAGQALPDE